MEGKSVLIVLVVVSVVAAVAVGWTVVGKISKRTTPTPAETGVPVAGVPTAAEKTPETSKVVLDETKTSSGETFKAVSGKVVSVSGRTLVLEVEGDQLQISVATDAKIVRTTLPSAGGTPQTAEITLSEIQIGQRVDALVKIKEGQATASNINVIVAT